LPAKHGWKSFRLRPYWRRPFVTLLVKKSPVIGEVVETGNCLKERIEGRTAMTARTTFGQEQRSVEIAVGRRKLEGMLNAPHEASGIVLFAHGSGSGRFSPRNQYVARVLQHSGIATLLFDLLDEEEADDRSKVFDVALLAERLEGAAEWVQKQDELEGFPLGYFGASTGAAAALVAAACQGESIGAVVSRGGRPDLAKEALPLVTAPTLLIVGSNDEPVVELNQRALAKLRCTKELTVVPGATHPFVEPGALEHVAQLASEWFLKHLQARTSSQSREA
jgi:putative phosphoribosyl transferase